MKEFTFRTLLVGALCVATLAAVAGGRAVGQSGRLGPEAVAIGTTADGGFFAVQSIGGSWYGCQIKDGKTSCSQAYTN